MNTIPRNSYRGLRRALTVASACNGFSGDLVSSCGTVLGWRREVPRARESLLTLRRDFGLSRGHLSGLFGVPVSTVRRWEEGQRNPSAAARKLIWLVHQMMKASAPNSLGDLIRWQARP